MIGEPSTVAEWEALYRRVEASAKPGMGADEVARLRQLLDDVGEGWRQASATAQAAVRRQATVDALAAAARRIRVHPSHHPGSCSSQPPSSWSLPVDEARMLARLNHVHADAGQELPDNWPASLVDVSPLSP